MLYNNLTRLACVGALMLLTAGCSEDDSVTGTDGEGTARFTVWGEEYIEQEIPATDFEDGWRVTFDTFLIALGDVRVADTAAGGGATLSSQFLLDLAEAGPHEIGTLQLGARGWNDVGYSVTPASAGTVLHGTTNDADRSAMGSSSIVVAGSAEKGGVTKTFRWSFNTSTSYVRCVAQKDGRETPGIVVTNGGTDTVELTIHGDHFFYDDLVSDDAKLRFDAMAAADANDDGEVTLDELRQVRLVDLTAGSYGTGSLSNVNDLGAFVEALTRTLGHFRGEGHCDVQ